MSQFNSPNSCHIFTDSKISDDDDGDLNILWSGTRTYSKDKESRDSGNEKSFHISTTNTKNTASSSLSCENDLFIDENIHSESEKTHENKKMKEDSLISLFDNEEDKYSASGCDFSNKVLSPTFPDKTYQQTRKNLKRKVLENELKLNEPKVKHPSSNMLFKSVQTFNQQSSASLSRSSKVKLNYTKGNIEHSPLHEANGKCAILKKEKTSVLSYNTQFVQNSKKEMNKLDFVRRYSVEQNQAYINSRKSDGRKKPEGSKISEAKKLTCGPKSSIQKIAPKLTGVEKGYNKSKKCQKSNDTVIEKSTTTHKLNHDNFKRIKSPDIDKHSMQKPLKRSHDESNSESSVLHSSPLPPFITHSTEINEDSTECVQVDQRNTARTSYLEISLKDLSDNLESNCAFTNDDLGILSHNLMSHTTVIDFCSHHDTCSVLSNLCFGNDSRPLFYKKKNPEMHLDNGDFEKFLNYSVLSLIENYVRDTIFDMFPETEILGNEMLSTTRIFQYVYGRCNNNETLYVTRFFRGGEFLNLNKVISRLNCIGLLLIYDDFKKENIN